MRVVFDDFDLEQFWEPSEYALKEYVGAPLSEEFVTAAERELGYKLPSSYIEMMKFQNGGIPRRRRHRTKEPNPWSNDYIAITGIFSMDREKPYSLCGEFGSRFWIDSWEYPAIGVYFADCPSGGHDMVCLDYRECGPDGEPRVVHVSQEMDYKITLVAENFESFVRGLEAAEAFDDKT
jgi:hypothetical protein